MAYQSGRQVSIAFKEQPDMGEKPGASGATGFRLNSGGLNLTKAPIQSAEVRRDGQTTRARHGSRSVTGSLVGEMSLGTFDALFAALFKGTFDAPLVLTEASGSPALTSITTGAHTIIAAAGSWITAGLRVGNVIRLAGHSTAANNGRNLRITGLTASTITVAETLEVNAVADTAFTVTRPKTLLPGSVSKAFTFEEVEEDIDGSEIFDWCRVGSLELAIQPNGMAMLTWGIVGRNMETAEGVDSPYFTDVTYTESQPLTAVEMRVLFGTEEVIDLSGCTLTFDRRAAGAPVIGSDLTPDVFVNTMTISGSITGLRSDFSRTEAFLNEEDLSLHLLFAENEAEPADFVAINLGYISIASASKSEIGQDGPRTQSLELMIGVDPRGGAYAPAMASVQTSAA